MTDSCSFTVLDVGHGSCAVLVDGTTAIIFDGGPRGTLMEFLDHHSITEVAAVLVSHADEDHIAGLLTPLLNGVVREVYLNPDAAKRTDTWQDLRTALKTARERYRTEVHTELTTVLTGQISLRDMAIEILAPEPEVATSGPGGMDLDGRRLTANAMSAVIRLLKNGTPVAILPGDVARRTLDPLLKSKKDISALMLLFPHHGGRLEGDTVRELCRSVNPQCVVFSIGRGKHGTPRPEVVQTIREAVPGARIVCTQLSEHCAAELPGVRSAHLLNIPAAGMDTNSCCAGTIVVDLSQSSPVLMPLQENHDRFIRDVAPTALCRR